MTRALAFPAPAGPVDYGWRLSRLRWRRAAGAGRVREWNEATPAAALLSGTEDWVLVRDASAIPLEEVTSPGRGRVAAARQARPSEGAVHTLRELAAARRESLPETGEAPAVAFRASDFPPLADETVEFLLRRLGKDPDSAASFSVFTLDEPSDRERPEVTARLPAGPARILDAGCGAGGLALARARNPAWEVIGIEKDPELASWARKLCDRVLEGDLDRVLPDLAARGERFDAVVFADVLEHLEEPVAALLQARALVGNGGLLVVSVPNVAHLSIARDLLVGRHDPVPAGLCDAGHLRWFTRASLRDALEEAGWTVETIEPIAGAPAPDPRPFLELAAAWSDADFQSLSTYQWIATARAG